MFPSGRKGFSMNKNSVLHERKTRKVSQNPFIQTIHTADPSAHVWDDGRMYIYASRDMDPPRGCDLMDHYHVYSSEDLVNWRDEGEILWSGDVEWGRPEGGFMWAPDCAYRNGKYYFYFPHPSDTRWNDSWKVGVAVSDHPAKDFKSIGYIEGLGGDCMIDPCVFVDDDDKVYMYYGGGGMCLGGEMNDDMVSMKEEMHWMTGLEDFHEATWVFKRNDWYYLTYSDNHPENNRLLYAMSKNPLGPWEYKGVYLEPTGCDTSHGSVVNFKGDWYALYHCCDISHRGNLRSICIDPIVFNEDGTMQTVVQSRNGRLPVGPAPAPARRIEIYTAKDASLEGSVHPEEEGQSIFGSVLRGFDTPDSSVTFFGVEGFEGGRVNIGFYYAARRVPAPLAKLRLFVNDQELTLLNFPWTGSVSNFTGYANITVNLNPGAVNTIKLAADSGELSLEAISAEPLD